MERRIWTAYLDTPATVEEGSRRLWLKYHGRNRRAEGGRAEIRFKSGRGSELAFVTEGQVRELQRRYAGHGQVVAVRIDDARLATRLTTWSRRIRDDYLRESGGACSPGSAATNRSSER